MVLAACNDGSNLDPAVVRSGRLDRRFHVGLPGEDDLGRILLHHLLGLAEADVQPVAMMLAGSASGADAVRVARDARQAARADELSWRMILSPSRCRQTVARTLSGDVSRSMRRATRWR